jgi:predicted RNase H-like nuclease (RuvC/YqgF family)
MSFISDNVKYQPPFNSVLDQVEELKHRVEELENENRHLHKILYALDERINILTDDKH